MEFKFERLEVWQLALDYLDLAYQVVAQLPKSEDYNLKAQLIRAATSISLTIAEGSTSQTDAEQGRFLGIALRSAIETIACLRLIERRKYVTGVLMTNTCTCGEKLFAKLQAFRKSLEGPSDAGA
jgi:four helix bundle protein